MIPPLVVICTPTQTPPCMYPAPGWAPWYPACRIYRPTALRNPATPCPATRSGRSPPRRALHTAQGAHTPPAGSTILQARLWITGRPGTPATLTRWMWAAETSTASLGPSVGPTRVHTLRMSHRSSHSCPRLGPGDLSITRCCTPCRAEVRLWFEDQMEVRKTILEQRGAKWWSAFILKSRMKIKWLKKKSFNQTYNSWTVVRQPLKPHNLITVWSQRWNNQTDFT